MAGSFDQYQISVAQWYFIPKTIIFRYLMLKTHISSL